MKKFMFLMLLIIAVPLLAQDGQQWIIGDSLYNSTPGDTINQYNIGLKFDLLVYTQTDTSATAWEVKLELGTIYSSGSKIDTNWVTATLKDSTWGSVIYSVTKAQGNIEVTVWCPGVQLLRVTGIDAGYILNRKLWYTIKKCHRW